MRPVVHTRRWNDAALPGDGTRILVCRFRPRGLRVEDETWTEWWKELGPSAELHAAAYGKGQEALSFSAYRARYLEEMSRDPGRYVLRGLRARVQGGEVVTLLCSSACVDEARCHRSILRALLLGEAGTPAATP